MSRLDDDAEMARGDHERDSAIDRELVEQAERPKLAPRYLVESAVIQLVREQGEIAARFAEAIEALRSVPTAIDCGDRAEASRLLSAAADIECDITGDTHATASLFDALGLTDLANPEGV